jgi:hypothetical protein
MSAISVIACLHILNSFIYFYIFLLFFVINLYLLYQFCIFLYLFVSFCIFLYLFHIILLELLITSVMGVFYNMSTAVLPHFYIYRILLYFIVVNCYSNFKVSNNIFIVLFSNILFVDFLMQARKQEKITLLSIELHLQYALSSKQLSII